MDLLKALRRTTILTTAALLALGATEAGAAVDTDVVGHISASVQGTLNVAEAYAVRFGNMSVACNTGCLGTATLILTPLGGRQISNVAMHDAFTLLTGGGTSDTNGGGHSASGTGAQAPGIYNITGGIDAATVYVSFADPNGNIIDPTYYPNNNTPLTGPGGASFTVDTFTFQTSDKTTGYSGTAEAPTIYGESLALDASGNATLLVGATLHTVSAGVYTAGQYTGTFNLMVSY
jgi:hypothetical protein